MGAVETRPAMLFDLDGTLVDSVYQHVLAWRAVLADAGIDLSVWRIHRRVGMSGGLLVNAILRETGRSLGPEEVRQLQEAHGRTFEELIGQVRPLPGAVELLERLTELGIPWAIATSGGRATAIPTLDVLGMAPEVVVTREEVPYAKPDPHLFLEAARRLGVSVTESIVVGDSIWDMLAAVRARAFGVALLSGGYGREELERTGAFRVYEDTDDLGRHLDELGIRPLRH
jgi:HAD superfamily hydrolase (TIGR01549 family)